MPRFAASHLKLFCLFMSNKTDARLILVNLFICGTSVAIVSSVYH